MKIDSHQHFWKYNSQTYSWIPEEMAVIRKDFTPKDLQPLLSENGFSGCVLVQAGQSEEETETLLQYARQHDFIKGVVGWLDLTSQDVYDRLEFFSKSPFLSGVRHTVWDEKGEFMTAPNFQRGIAALADFGLTYDILVFDYQLYSAVELVKRFPNQRFVLDHMGKPRISEGLDEKWVQNIHELGKYGNVFCKISGLVTETENFSWKSSDFLPFLDVVLESFGTDRLLFGSDWPVCLSAASYSDVVEVVESYFNDFSEIEKAKIFGGNAAKFYNLK